MDADTRPNSAVMAYVGKRGATFGGLRRRLGWDPERLEAALRDLVRSYVLVRRDGVYFRREDVPQPTDDPPPSRPVRTIRSEEMEARYRYVVAQAAGGRSLDDLAAELNVKPKTLRGLVTRARKWLQERGQAVPETGVKSMADFKRERKQRAVDAYTVALELRNKGYSYQAIAEHFGKAQAKTGREIVLRALRWRHGGGE